MTGWQLRPMSPGDLPQVARLERELFGAEAWSLELLAAELEATTGRWGPADRHYLVVEPHPTVPQLQPEASARTMRAPEADPNLLLGYAGVWVGDGRGAADLLTIATVPTHRRQGIAKALLAGAVSAARTAGCPTLLLEVRESNTAAQNLYQGSGFETIGRRRRYYAAPVEDALVMRRNL